MCSNNNLTSSTLRINCRPLPFNFQHKTVLTPPIPILTYHQVSLRLNRGAVRHAPLAVEKYILSPQAFSSQMSWLAGRGYTPISLEALLACRRGEDVLPNKPVMITFDDGYQDLIRYAVPILQKHAFPAIFYLVAGLVGQTNAWMEGPGEIPLMDWDEARQLIDSGFQIGSHSMHHPKLAEIPLEDVRNELADSRHLLELRLGCEIRHLAYPHGAYNEAVQRIAGETGYHSAVSIRIGLSNLTDDVYALQRVPMSRQDSMLDFICKLRTARNFRKSFKLARRNWRGSLKRAMHFE